MSLEGVSPLPARSVIGSAELGPALHPAPPGGSEFEQLMSGLVENANRSALGAQAAGERFAAGQADDIHGTMLALSKADIELRVLGSVRNKLVDAFYELWRMSV